MKIMKETNVEHLFKPFNFTIEIETKKEKDQIEGILTAAEIHIDYLIDNYKQKNVQS